MRVRMGQTISQSTVVLEHYLPGSSPTRHFDHREDPGDEVGNTILSSAMFVVAAASFQGGHEITNACVSYV